jgi:hypothetical protein
MRLAIRNARRMTRWSPALWSVGFPLWMFFIASWWPFSLIGNVRYVPEWAGVLITLTAVAAFAPVLLLAGRLERALGWSAAVRVLAVLALVGAQSLVLLSVSSDQHRRCVDTQTMTVIPDQSCDHPVKLAEQPFQQPPAPGVPLVLGAAGAQWYLGGTGVNLGDQARGGSISRPAANDDDGGGGSGEDSGGSGEDPGGDGGYEAPAGGYGGGAGEEPGEEPGGGAGDDGGAGFSGGGEGGE